MKNILVVFLLYMVLPLFNISYSQDAKWEMIKDSVRNTTNLLKYDHIYLATNDDFITTYPLYEISLWIHAELPYNNNTGRTSLVMSRIRFSGMTRTYKITSTYKWKRVDDNNEMVQILTKDYEQSWRGYLNNKSINRQLWKFIGKYFE